MEALIVLTLLILIPVLCYKMAKKKGYSTAIALTVSILLTLIWPFAGIITVVVYALLKDNEKALQEKQMYEEFKIKKNEEMNAFYKNKINKND